MSCFAWRAEPPPGPRVSILPDENQFIKSPSDFLPLSPTCSPTWLLDHVTSKLPRWLLDPVGLSLLLPTISLARDDRPSSLLGDGTVAQVAGVGSQWLSKHWVSYGHIGCYTNTPQPEELLARNPPEAHSYQSR